MGKINEETKKPSRNNRNKLQYSFTPRNDHQTKVKMLKN